MGNLFIHESCRPPLRLRSQHVPIASAEVRHGAAHLPAGFEFFYYRVHLFVVSLALAGFQPQGSQRALKAVWLREGRPARVFLASRARVRRGRNYGENDRYFVRVNVVD